MCFGKNKGVRENLLKWFTIGLSLVVIMTNHGSQTAPQPGAKIQIIDSWIHKKGGEFGSPFLIQPESC